MEDTLWAASGGQVFIIGVETHAVEVSGGGACRVGTEPRAWPHCHPRLASHLHTQAPRWPLPEAQTKFLPGLPQEEDYLENST